MKFKLNKSELKILNLLTYWRNEDQRVYELDRLQNIEYFQEPQLLDPISLYGLSEDNKKQFFEIGGTGEGSYYALWTYPELNGMSPPVVFIGGDGHYCMVAPSLEAWAGLLACNKYLFSEVEDYTTPVWQNGRSWHPDLSEIVDEFELDGEESAELALKNDIKRFKQLLEKQINIKSFPEYMNEMQQHKDFRYWYKYVNKIGNNTNQYVYTKGNYYEPFIRVPVITEFHKLESLIESLHCPIGCEQLAATFKDFGLRVPEIKGENQLIISAQKELGLDFRFGNRFIDSSELKLNKISVYNNCDLEFPFGIDRLDPYELITYKIGFEAQYTHRISKNMRIWIFEKDDNNFFQLVISFRDKHLLSWSGLVLSAYNPEKENPQLSPL